MIKLTEQEFKTISTFIRKNFGLNMEKKEYLIESKLWIELARCKAENYTQYWQKLLADPTGKMKEKMVDLLTTNYTYFCREEKHFEFLEKQIVPSLELNRNIPFRILCAGCATGQECYTLAMLLLDCQKKGNLKSSFEILGTDISKQAIASAKKGTYGCADYARLPLYWQNEYCHPYGKGEFAIKDKVKAVIQFKNHNLMYPLDSSYGKFDLIFCRNVLIYFKEKERNHLLELLVKSLVKDGYLFIGHTESLIGTKLPLRYLQPAVYQKMEG